MPTFSFLSLAFFDFAFCWRKKPRGRITAFIIKKLSLQKAWILIGSSFTKDVQKIYRVA